MPLNDELPEDVDVLIVGSGFGGSVMAKELAGKYESICLVERGGVYPPGSFPRDPAGVSRNFWDTDAHLYGMFDVWSFQHLDAIVASGLGGGSLIYANVMLRKDDKWFEQRKPKDIDVEEWTLRPHHLEEHYDKVHEFLDVQELPHTVGADTVDPEFDLEKTKRFLQGIELAGGDGGYAPLAVRFRTKDGKPAIGAPLPEEDEDYPNIHGDVHRRTCRLIGECDLGCNEGAKNSLDHTYLSYASDMGVSIHTLTEVVAISRRRDTTGGYLFDVKVHVHQPPSTAGAPDPGVKDPSHWSDFKPSPYPPETEGPPRFVESTISARRVVLAAGALGSTYLLLANEAELGLEAQPVGQRFCGNGDVLGLVNGAYGNLECTKGPVITAYRRYAADTDAPDDPGWDGDAPIQHGMYIEDAGYPAFAAWLVQLLQSPGMVRGFLGEAWDKWWQDFGDEAADTNLSAELTSVLRSGGLSAKFMPLLGMGRDTPDGVLSLLPSGMLDSDWSVKGSGAYLDRMDDRMNSIARGLGGEYCRYPLRTLADRLITVHPVGGCPSDTNMFPGVVDTFGRVRDVPGLRVCDGSVFPGPVGPNPSFTIAAFARRSAFNLLEENDLKVEPPCADAYTGQ
jgi:cholesterol oxidase